MYQQPLQPDCVFFWYCTRIRLTTVNGKLRIAGGNQPAVEIEKPAAHRVKGRSQRVFW